MSDRAVAAVANAVLQDVDLISNENKNLVIDKNKVRREREKFRKEIQKEEDVFWSMVNGVYIDGRKDSTLTNIQNDTNTYSTQTISEDHHVVVGEPGGFYLTHLTTDDGKGLTVAKALGECLENTDLKERLVVIGTDGTASMTGPHTGFIRCLELLLKKPLQWSICLLHCNELPFRHVFKLLDGTTNSPDSFNGPIGKVLGSCVSKWPVVRFKRIKSSGLKVLPDEVVNDLSTDQNYAYRMCLAVSKGTVEKSLQLLTVGPIVHSRWLTLACRILRFYVSTKHPSENLILLAKFCIEVYFPSWFEIKQQNTITDGSRNLFKMIERVRRFPHKQVSAVAQKAIQNNAYFSHPENILVAMLGDTNVRVRKLAVDKIVSIPSRKREEQEPEDVIRKFTVPEVNFKASVYYKMTDLDDVGEPPLTTTLTNEELERIISVPAQFKQPCHSQAVERHIRLVSEASSKACTFERRDGIIRQRIRSRKLVKFCETKRQFSQTI